MRILNLRTTCAATVLLATALSLPASAGAQEARSDVAPARVRPWLVAASGAVHRIGWEPGTSWGGSLTIGRYVPKRVGFEVSLSYAGPAGYYDFNGAVLDVGATYTVPVSRPLSLALSAGGSGILGGDSDGSGAADGGGYGGVAVLWHIAPMLVFRTAAVGRVMVAGPEHFVPTAQVGLGVAF